jgi:hypothetical protein
MPSLTGFEEAHAQEFAMPILFTTINAPAATDTDAYGINNASQIVGGYSAGGQHGFLLSGGSYTTLDAPSASSTVATRINVSGQIVGFDVQVNVQLHAGGMQ